MRKIDPKKIEANAIKLIGEQWMLITAGTPEKCNAMTASWGALGELWSRPVAFVFIRPQRYTYGFMESGDTVTLSFFGEEYRSIHKVFGGKSGRDTDKVAETGLTPFETDGGGISYREASIILDCRKLYAQPLRADAFTVPGDGKKIYPEGDFHKMYVLEITGAWVK